MRGGAFGSPNDYSTHDALFDFSPAGHNWDNLKYCITKKVASDINASIDAQIDNIKDMFRRVIFFHLHTYLTTYDDSVQGKHNIPEQIRTIALNCLDELCAKMSTHVCRQIFALNILDPGYIHHLKNRIEWPTNNSYCTNLKVPEYTTVPQTILGDWMTSVLQTPPPEKLASQYPATKDTVPRIFHPAKIDKKKFKKNTWFRGLHRVGKYLAHRVKGEPFLADRLEKDRLDLLKTEERELAVSSTSRRNVNKHNRLPEWFFYQSQPYMLKIVYDRLEPVLRSISEDPDEMKLRLFYYASIKFVRTIAETFKDQQAIHSFVKNYILWINNDIEKIINFWKEFCKTNENLLLTTGDKVKAITDPEYKKTKITHWTIFCIYYYFNTGKVHDLEVSFANFNKLYADKYLLANPTESSEDKEIEQERLNTLFRKIREAEQTDINQHFKETILFQ
jgi:hypothetical protein